MRLACAGLFSAVEKNATIITSSPLLARVAEHQIASERLKSGVQSWRRTPVYSIDAWLAACWHEARYASGAGALLSRSQERFLWRTIIEQDHPELFDPNAAARLASRAAELLAAWRIPTEGERWNDHADAQQFLSWLKVFRRRCRDEGWIAPSDIWRLVPQWMAEGICGREPVAFLGLEHVGAALKAMMAALPVSRVLDFNPRIEPGARAKSFLDLAQQLEYAARYARALCEQNPGQSIAVFVPDLLSNRSLVEHVFETVFYPSRRLGASASYSAFHIHPARPLMEEAVVANALLLLELGKPRVDQADAGAILRSPFITGAAIERSGRAQADLELRKRRELDVSLGDLESVTAACQLLHSVWIEVRRVLREQPKDAEFARWSRFMRDLLNAMGWPGEANLSPTEQEAAEECNNALSSLAALGLVSGRVAYDDAQSHLRRLLARPGVERGDCFSPVQILDTREAQALRFDQALVTGLSDETWPPALDLSPLIPLTLQREYDVPGSSADTARSERERLTEALFCAAPNVLATYSGRLSPAAEKWVRRMEEDGPLWNGKTARQSFAPASLEEVEDILAPPFTAIEPDRGGASLIKAQSLCPFRAFAEFRLHARAPEDACFGFDARERGGFVHKALQLVWNRLGDYETLRSTAHEQLGGIVRDGVMEAVREQHTSPLRQLTTRTERERLEELILTWLEIERARKQAFTVENIEQERVYEVPGLRLRLRIDRMDRLANGKVLLIDYKSGRQTRNKLNCPRPPEPQLLLYAAAAGHDVDGVFFGELMPREPRAVGVSRERYFPGQSTTIVKDWTRFLDEAQAEMQRLADEFVQGYAAVDPLPGACEYCQIKPVCRVQDSGEEKQDDE